MTNKKLTFLVLATILTLFLTLFTLQKAEIAKAIHANDTVEPKDFGATSISLQSKEERKVSWSVEGSANAFKLVWSKNSQPTYPPRKGDRANYHASTSTFDTLTAFDGTGLYYARVCEYLDGSCGAYSNQITVNLGSEQKTEEKVVKEENHEISKTFSYFNNLFLRLKKLSLTKGIQPSAVITPQAKITIIDGELLSKEGETIVVEVSGLLFEVDASRANIDGGSGSLSFEDLEGGDRLLVKGEVGDNLVKADIIYDRSVRSALVERLETEINSLLERIKELQGQLRGLK